MNRDETVSPEELRQAYANAFIELVMENTAAAGVDIGTKQERAIVIDALRDTMRFFAHPTRWDKIH